MQTITRSRPLAWMSVVLLAASRLPVAVSGEPAQRTVTRPNIVLILTDQQHAGMMSCTGNRWLRTPAMDALAAQGARFERAYCGNPVCVPSRFAMMTGVLPSRIGIDRNVPASTPVPATILEHSLGMVFRNAGYETAYGGKVHLPGTRAKGIGAYGFERLTGDERDGLASSCADFLAREHEKPFLLVASFINPHDICYMAIDAWANDTGNALPYPSSRKERRCLAEALRIPPGLSRTEFFEKLCPPLPPNFEIPAGEPPAVRSSAWRPFRQYVQEHWSHEDWRLHRWAYARLTERVDVQIGTVLEAIRSSGLERRTLIVLTSDHGDMDASHKLEHKSTMYEEALRVPLIVSWKGVTVPARVDRTHLVSNALDLIPTLCDFAGVSKPPTLAGRSLKPLVVDGRGELPWRSHLAAENERSRILWGEHYKYAVYDQGEPREALVQLGSDPGEMRNLASTPSAKPTLERYRKLLVKWYEENGETLGDKSLFR